MKNMNNKKLFAVLAAVTVLFASCNNGLQTKNPDVPEGKARISFRIDDVSRNMASNAISWDDIGKIVIKVKKWDTLANGQADTSQTPVDYVPAGCNSSEIFWMNSTDSVTNEISTAYDKLQTQELEFDFGWYKFDLELYVDTAGTNQCYYGGTYSSLIDINTTQLSFRAIPTGTGNLSVKFCWEYYPELPESADNLPIMYMDAGLYSDLACTTPVTDSELEKDFNDDYSAASTIYYNNWKYLDDEERDPVNAPPYEINWNYTVSDIPIGKYYLKYTLYYTNSVYDEGTGDYISENIKLNSFVEEVRINNLGISETREFEQDDVNKIPVIKGGFIFDSTLIDIESDSDNSGSDFYLNNGTITFRVKDHDTNKNIASTNVSVQLYYGSQEVDSSYYTFDKTKYNGTEGEPDFDPYFEFKLNEDKPLLTGGKYQLSIVATKPASATANTYGPFFYSARTIDLDVKPQVYFEFDVGVYPAVEGDSQAAAIALGNAMAEKLYGLRNDVVIKLYGEPQDVEKMDLSGNGDYYDTVSEKGYFYKISSTLNYMVKNTFVDLDMSEMEHVFKMDYSDNDCFQSCDWLRSIKLPKSLRVLTNWGISNCKNLEEIEFTIDDNEYDIYDIYITNRPITGVPALRQFKITNESNKETNLFTLDEGKVLLSKNESDASTATIVSGSRTAESIAIPLDGDIRITGIDSDAFSGSNATSITGLDNVTTIGSYAFSNSKLETLGANVTGLTRIGEYAFKDSKLTTLPDLTKLTDNLGSGAFSNCQNLQTVTIDDNFLALIDSNRCSFDTFAGCVTQNLTFDAKFNLTYSSNTYDLSGVSSNKLPIIKQFTVTDTLTFNDEVTLPDLTSDSLSVNDSTRFFFSIAGSDDSIGLAHIVFNGKSYIGKGQFSNFCHLSSIIFADESGESEIGEQAFWLDEFATLYSDEYDDEYHEYKSGTRRPEDIVLNGVRKIGYQAINKVTKTGTLTIPQSVIAIHNGAFADIMNGVTIEVEGEDSDRWLLLSKSEAENTINGWIADPSTFNSTTTNSEANPYVEVNDILSSAITIDNLKLYTGNDNGNKWYYRWTSN